MRIILAMLIATSMTGAFARDCHDPSNTSYNRFTNQMIKIKQSDVTKVGNTIISRKNADQVFLANITDHASNTAIAASCNGSGLTPVFSETLCNGETNLYIIREHACIEDLTTTESGRLIRNRDESIEFYPGSLTAWTFGDGERMILLPLTVTADILVLPFATLIAIEDVADNIARRRGQRRIERNLHKKDVKVNHRSLYNAVKAIIY